MLWNRIAVKTWQRFLIAISYRWVRWWLCWHFCSIRINWWHPENRRAVTPVLRAAGFSTTLGLSLRTEDAHYCHRQQARPPWPQGYLIAGMEMTHFCFRGWQFRQCSSKLSLTGEAFCVLDVPQRLHAAWGVCVTVESEPRPKLSRSSTIDAWSASALF